MNATTAADGAGTNATNATTTNTTTNRPTVVSPNRDIEENAAPYNDTEPKAPPYNETADNAGTAPLLPTYSFAMRPTPPRTTWRRMTGGLVAERNAEQDTEASKHPGVIRVYFSKTSFLLMQWFFTPWVLGTQALHLSGDLPSVVPMLAYLLICVSARSLSARSTFATSPATDMRFLGCCAHRRDVLLRSCAISRLFQGPPAAPVVSD